MCYAQFVALQKLLNLDRSRYVCAYWCHLAYVICFSSCDATLCYHYCSNLIVLLKWPWNLHARVPVLTDIFGASHASDYVTSRIHSTRRHVQQHWVTSSDDNWLHRCWTAGIMTFMLLIHIAVVSAFLCLVFSLIDLEKRSVIVIQIGHLSGKPGNVRELTKGKSRGKPYKVSGCING